MDYVKFYRGSSKCEIIESDISEERAEELRAAIEEVNKKNAAQNCYFAIMGDEE